MYSYDKNDIATLKSVDIRIVDKSSLVDLNSVHIDESKPVQERVLSFLQQIQNRSHAYGYPELLYVCNPKGDCS